MNGPHVKQALLAILLMAVCLWSFSVYAGRLERRYIHAVAPLHTPRVPDAETEMMFPQKTQGRALQRAAFREPALLPLYGSSEVAGYPYDAAALFRSYPTGFTVFPIGWADTTCLKFLQQFAAVGRDLRGKKVVISLSPSWFSRARWSPQGISGTFRCCTPASWRAART